MQPEVPSEPPAAENRAESEIPIWREYLSGDICYRYEKIAQRLQREISAKALDRSKGSIRIYPSSQDPQVGVLAAADVVFSQFFTV